MQRLKVLLVCQNYHPLVGGVEIHARQVAQELSKRHAVAVAGGTFTSPRVRPAFAPLQTSLLAPKFESYHDGPVRVHALTPSTLDRVRMLPIALRAVPRLSWRFYHSMYRFGYPWFRAVYLPRLRKLMREFRPDVVHSLAGGYLGWTAQRATREWGVPFVCTPFVHPHQWGDGPADVAYYKQSDAVIGLVQTDADYLAEIGVPQRKLNVIGVSPELPATTSPAGFRERHRLGDAPVVLYVGRMMPQKGATSVLAAAAKVWATPETRFVFIGPASADEAKAFENVDPRIKYLGKVSQQEKGDALAACDVFCMPSMSEILPTVYLEAWSYGKPVVGGRAHGLPELVEGNGGGIAASQDAGDVAAALTKLVQDATLRNAMGERGRKLVAEKYSVPAVTGALLGLYQQVIRETSSYVKPTEGTAPAAAAVPA